MGIQGVLVRVTAAVFALYGLGFVLMPARLSRLTTGTVPDSAAAWIDLRATYGGLSLAVGAILWLLASKPSTLRDGLWAVLLLMLGMAGGRLYGIVMDGSPNTVMWIYLGFELVAVALAAFLLRSGRSPGRA